MKKIFLTTAITLVVICCSLFYSYPQAGNTVKDQAKQAPDYFAEHFDVNKFSKMRLNDVNVKAIRDFIKQFGNASNVEWYKVADGLIAQLSAKGIETKVNYDLKGNWHCTLCTYGEDKMPFDVRDIVKSKYYDFNILVVYEITYPDNVTYIIKIKDSKKIKTLRVSNGEMEIIGDYVRS